MRVHPAAAEDAREVVRSVLGRSLELGEPGPDRVWLQSRWMESTSRCRVPKIGSDGVAT